MAQTNSRILAKLREKLGRVSHQAISQRRARIQALVPMPTDIATYIVADRAGVRLHRELDTATLEQVAVFEERLRSREEGGRRATAPPVPGGGKVPSKVRAPKELRVGQLKMPENALSPTHTADAQRMAEVYPLLYVFENSMREFIDGHLTASYGEKWWDDPKIVSTTIKLRVERNRAAEQKHRYHGIRNARFVYYTDLGDLPLIAHSENGWKVFRALLPSDKWLPGRVEVIEASRNVVAHMNPLKKRDIQRIQLNVQDWLEQIKGVRPSAVP